MNPRRYVNVGSPFGDQVAELAVEDGVLADRVNRLFRPAEEKPRLAFVSETLTGGRCIFELCVIDDFRGECLAAVVGTSLSGLRFARTRLDRRDGI